MWRRTAPNELRIEVLENGDRVAGFVSELSKNVQKTLIVTTAGRIPSITGKREVIPSCCETGISDR